MRKIFLAAIGVVHGCFILLLLFAPNYFMLKKKPQAILVRTVARKELKPLPQSVKPKASTPPAKKAPLPPKALEPPASQAKKASTASAKKAPLPPKALEPPASQAKKASTPPAKKAPLPPKALEPVDTQVKKLQKQQPVVNKKPSAAKKEVVSVSSDLVKELEESIAKMENKPAFVSKQSQKVAPILLKIDAVSEKNGELEAQGTHYIDSLVGHLHRTLSLPEYGQVKIELHLRQDGTVIKVVILSAESEKNKLYLEKNLPHLKFPRFEGSYAAKRDCVFNIVFCNEL